MGVRDVLPVRLREQRELNKWTQARLAEEIGVENVQISRYETGMITPSLNTLVRIADALQCSTDYLLGRSHTVRLSQDELNSDERRMVQAVRNRDIQTALVSLSLQFPDPASQHFDRMFDVEVRRDNREERNRLRRERYIARREGSGDSTSGSDSDSPGSDDQ